MLDWSTIGTAAGCIGGVLGVYLNFRRGIQKAVSDTALQQQGELQQLANTRRDEIDSLTYRLGNSESERIGLSALYDRALQSIRNLGDEKLRLQGDIDALTHDNITLRQRIVGLEKNARTNRQNGDLP